MERVQTLRRQKYASIVRRGGVSSDIMSAVETKDWGNSDTGREIIFLEEVIAVQGLG